MTISACRARFTLLGLLLSPVALLSAHAQRDFDSPAGSSSGGVVHRSALPLDTCTFESGGNACRGGLAADFFHKAGALQTLRTALNGALAQSKESRRQVACGLPASQKCPKNQYATTFVNKDSRAFPHLESLPADRAIIIGAIRFNSESSADRKYGVGEGLEESTDGRRLVFVAYRLAAPPVPPVPDNTPVARWTLFRLSGIGTPDAKIDSIKAGTVTNCKWAHPGEDPLRPESNFAACKTEAFRREIATVAKVSLSRAFSLPVCGKVCTYDVQTQLADFRKKIVGTAKQARFDIAVAGLAALAADTTNDVYWFTCASGCCTADM